MKPFLILQLRPETDASDDEYRAFLKKGGLSADRAVRIRLDCEPLPADLTLSDYAGVIVGGGPGCVSDTPEKKPQDEARIEAAVLSLMPEITARDMPFMGCCYGIGILGAHLGGDVSKEKYGEQVRAAYCTRTDAGRTDPLTANLPDKFQAFVGHKEALNALPGGCTHLVAGDQAPFQMVRYGQNVYATQFHPEADGAVFENRINIYRHHGYFHPDEAEDLIDMCHAADVRWPEQILTNFVARYG